ncbi:hypothetical protein FHR24_003127 [Wenyingzhuangia heitensis]|uniref:Uncharacterized protein n=1 Tax=Wenyingzhuangia heitensis TaxID=1487859 RepID=A0ABX0UCT7_9FLAO|nr:hypothetical protein [Wenyingzhuangia heitensis]NIJ46632.1 hypothetical protein [Wenyingzhuangia heitensis]
MKEKFNQVYDELYEIYPERFFMDNLYSTKHRGLERMKSEFRELFIKEELFAELIKREINKFEYENNYPFRYDAKYFLLINFNNMIVKPILHLIIKGDKEFLEPQINDLIKTDIKTILDNSLRLKTEEKISGHEIMKSIDTLWPNLNSTKMELWG